MHLRFDGFDEEWNIFKLGDISKLITKGTTPKKFLNEGISFIKVENIKNNKIKEINNFIDENTHLNELKRSILEENDLLFSIAGVYVGITTIIPKNILPANTNQALAIIRLKDKENINIKFVERRLNNWDIKKYIFQNIGVGAQPNLNIEQVGNINIKLPSIQEQNKIQKFFDYIDKNTELLEKKHEFYETFKKYLMQQIFTQKLR